MIAWLLLFAGQASAEDRFQTLYEFTGRNNPSDVSSLLQTSDGSLYGTTRSGGSFGGGTLFKLTPDGSFTVLYSFARATSATLAFESTPPSTPGLYGFGQRLIFRVAVDGTVTTFATEWSSITKLIQGRDGKMYGLAYGPSAMNFLVAADGTVTSLHTFTDSEGSCPDSLIQGSDSYFYGTSRCGGASHNGTVFRIAEDGSLTVLQQFSGAFSSPNSLVEGPDGALFGSIGYYPSYLPPPYPPGDSKAAVFRMTTDGAFAIVRTFEQNNTEFVGFDGTAFHYIFNKYDVDFTVHPTWLRMMLDGTVATFGAATGYLRSPVLGRDGLLYGSVCCEPTNLGRLIRFDTDSTVTTIHAFTWSPAGAGPGRLIEASDGNFYGTTGSGGTQNGGTLFRMTRWGRVDLLHEFGGAGGSGPGSLIQATDGSLYGTTIAGGAFGSGTIFRFSPPATFVVLHSFNREAEGSSAGRLIQAADGALYGTAYAGGPGGGGTVFRFDLSGSLTVLHSFAKGATDAGPSVLLQATDGGFYGTTSGPFYPLGGTVFRLLPDGSFITLHTFDGVTDGARAYTLVEGSDGNFYGTTICPSVIFRMTPDGQVTVLSRRGSSYYCLDDDVPRDDVVITLTPAPEGGFYGVKNTYYEDNLFAMTTEGTLTSLHIFNDDSRPNSIVRGRSGNLYGTTFSGGTSGSGTVFRYNLKPESLIYIDSPISAQVLVEPFVMSGWAFDATASADAGVDAIHVWAYPNPGSGQAPVFAGVATIGRPRPDVGASFGSQFAASGFELAVRGLAPGPYQFMVFAHHTMTASFDDTRSVDVTIAPNAPMAIDSPVQGATVVGPVRLSGWAVDRAAVSGTGVSTVHVWAYPNPESGQPPFFAGTATYGGARPDVGAIFGNQFTNSAYNLTVTGLATGDYRFVVFAYSTVSQSFLTAQTVTVHAVASTAMAVDVPVDGATVVGAFTISGWAIDRAAATGPGVDAVHVWAYPNPGSGQPPFFAGAATYGGVRPDVGAIFGNQFTNSAYTLTVSGLSPGDYQFVVFAYSTVSQSFNNAMRVTVHALASQAMAVDVPIDGSVVSGPFTISGWAIDRAATSGSGVDAVHVWAYPASGQAAIFLGAAAYGAARADVGAVFGNQFVNSAFTLVAPALATGRYQIVVFARSRVSGTFDNARALIVNVSQ